MTTNRSHQPGRRRRLTTIAVVCAVAVAAAVVTVVALTRHPGSPAAPGATAPVTTTTSAPTGRQRQVLAVKIDNVAGARPQTGIASAAIVYVEPVEGGLTRLMAVFTGTPPPVVGPVRSARHTDIDLLGQFGTPVFAYSGAAPAVLKDVRRANVVDASPATTSAAYQRSGTHKAPHNLYLHPGRLTATAVPPTQPPLLFGDAPVAGTPASRYSVAYRAASFGFTWSPSARRWSIAMDGTAVTDTAAGPVRASTVVVLRVQVHTDETVTDGHGRSPVAQTVGDGPAVVLREGRSIAAEWHRPAAAQPFRFTATGGAALPLAAGPVWLLLVPR